MKANYTVAEGDLRVVRPFAYVREKQVSRKYNLLFYFHRFIIICNGFHSRKFKAKKIS
jgi:hypothetical protein